MKTKKIKTKGKVTGVNEITEKEIWNKDELDKVREYILKESKKQSPEQKLRNELLSIQFKMEDYIQNNEIENEMNLSDFFKLYLKVLHLKQNQIGSFFLWDTDVPFGTAPKLIAKVENGVFVVNDEEKFKSWSTGGRNDASGAKNLEYYKRKWS